MSSFLAGMTNQVNLYDLDKETIDKAKEDYRNSLRDNDEEIKALAGMAKTKAIFKKANAFFEKESPELRKFLEEKGYLLPAPPQDVPDSKISISDEIYQQLVNTIKTLKEKLKTLEDIVEKIHPQTN